VKNLFTAHSRSLIAAIAKLIKSPMEHIINILTISVIIAILSSVFVITKSSVIWEKNNLNFPQIMIYLNQDAKQADISKLEAAINHFNQKLIKNYQFVSKEQGLNELREDNKFKIIASDVLENNANPLPDILIVNTNSANSKLLEQLTKVISRIPMVDDVQMDSSYANKIDDLINFIKKIATFLQIVFIIMFLLVLYNMIRLQMLICKDEITVSRLIGASDSFIMRPLAYYATLQVILAGAIAYLLVNLFINFINGLFNNLHSLFGHEFLLSNFSRIELLELLFILIIFTIFAVFLAVQWVFKHSYSQ
jgi:cell division transport system permease protein